jgi:MFS family permease
MTTSRDFGRFFVGNSLSATGGWLQNLAAAIYVWRETHDPLMLGVLNASQYLPILLLAPWAGAAADHYDKRRLLVATQVVSAAAAAGLAVSMWLGEGSVGAVVAVAAVVGTMSAFSNPASTAFLGWIVKPHDLPTAVALESMSFNIARSVGPPLAAASVATVGVAASFALNAASYLVFVAALVTLRPRPHSRSARRPAPLRRSIALLRERPRIAAFLLLIVAITFASDPVATLAPAYMQMLGRSDTHAGFVVGAFGAGAVAAALVFAGRVTGSRSRMTATLCLLGGGALGYGVSPSLPVAYVCLFAAGFGFLASNTSTTSRLQLGVDEFDRGKVMALWGVAFMGFRPVASMLDGFLARSFGVRAAIVCLALPPLLASAIIYLKTVPARAGTAESTVEGGSC